MGFSGNYSEKSHYWNQSIIIQHREYMLDLTFNPVLESLCIITRNKLGNLSSWLT